MHSYYSDGVLSPGQLVKKFKEEGYDVIALTDHDGIEGVKEFLAACEAEGGSIRDRVQYESYTGWRKS